MAGGKTALKGLKKALGLNTENKDFDIPLAGVINPVLTQVSTITSGLTQGINNQQRTGNGMRITHYKYRGTFTNSAAPMNVNQQRVRVIWTLQTALTLPGNLVTAAQLLQVPGNIDSPYNSDLEGVKILQDKTYVIRPYTTQQATVPYKFKYSPTYDNGQVQWTDADINGLDGNLTKGAIQMFIMTDSGAALPAFTGYGRLHYVDN